MLSMSALRLRASWSLSAAAVSGPVSTHTEAGSGGLLRKAIPSATASKIGNPNVQKTALGSR
jgi:hypothetical protein